jgi:hypothetical protein
MKMATAMRKARFFPFSGQRLAAAGAGHARNLVEEGHRADLPPESGRNHQHRWQNRNRQTPPELEPDGGSDRQQDGKAEGGEQREDAQDLPHWLGQGGAALGVIGEEVLGAHGMVSRIKAQHAACS